MMAVTIPASLATWMLDFGHMKPDILETVTRLSVDRSNLNIAKNMNGSKTQSIAKNKLRAGHAQRKLR